jgi:L-alanine-DL-glutamate epimerase-like enolase superfamily enzyme
MISRRKFLGASGAAIAGLAGAGIPSVRANSGAVPRAPLNTLKITDVKTAAIDIGYTTHLVKVTTDSGLFGIGEAYPKAEVADDIAVMKRTIVGEDPLQVEVLTHKLVDQYQSRGSRAGALSGAIAGIETALWDLAGKILGVPVYVLLGGAYRKSVLLYNDVDSPRGDDPKAWADAAVRSRDFGYRAVKHSLPRFDSPKGGQITLSTMRKWTRIMEATRAALGPEFPIGIDLHWRYNVGDTVRFTGMIKDLDVWFLEDPIQPENVDAHVFLREKSHVPILTGENLYNREGFRPFIERQACDMIHFDAQKSGGLLEMKRTADWADLHSMPLFCHNGATPVGTIASAHACMAIKSFVALETDTVESDKTPHWQDIIQRDGPLYKDGHLKVSDKPGLGIELNEEVCKAHLADDRGFFA